MTVGFFQVDAFTDKPFRGNPAAVCLMESQESSRWLQAVASENNLSETAFVWRNGNHFDLRWFTPKTEVELCGHATLATSHVLWESGWLEKDKPAVFQTLSGQLSAERSSGKIFMDFPSKPPTPADVPDGLLEHVPVDPIFVGSDKTDLFIQVASEDEVNNVNVDFKGLAQIDARGVILTSASESDDVDFMSRFFAPACGIDEDPVTGSAHCLLAPYWAEKLGKKTLVGYQASKRGGRLDVEVVGDRVRIGGQAITVIKGELML